MHENEKVQRRRYLDIEFLYLYRATRTPKVGDCGAKANRVSALMLSCRRRSILFLEYLFLEHPTHTTHTTHAPHEPTAPAHISKPSKQVSMLPATHFGATSAQPKQLSGAFLFAAGQASFRILSAPLGSSERARRREGGPHHERTGTYAEN